MTSKTKGRHFRPEFSGLAKFVKKNSELNDKNNQTIVSALCEVPLFRIPLTSGIPACFNNAFAAGRQRAEQSIHR
jgi:hypothetical protein